MRPLVKKIGQGELLTQAWFCYSRYFDCLGDGWIGHYHANYLTFCFWPGWWIGFRLYIVFRTRSTWEWFQLKRLKFQCMVWSEKREHYRRTYGNMPRCGSCEHFTLESPHHRLGGHGRYRGVCLIGWITKGERPRVSSGHHCDKFAFSSARKKIFDAYNRLGT